MSCSFLQATRVRYARRGHEQESGGAKAAARAQKSGTAVQEAPSALVGDIHRRKGREGRAR
jgi:hypothetical protein